MNRTIPALRRLTVSLLGITVLVVGLGASCTFFGQNGDATPTPTVSLTPTPEPTAPAQVDATPGPLSGTWLGTWHNTAPVVAYGTFVLKWTQQGDALVGVITVDGSNCLVGGDVEGTISGTDLQFGAIQSTTKFSYAGHVVNADALVGSYTSNCQSAAGTWEAYRQGTAPVASALGTPTDPGTVRTPTTPTPGPSGVA